MLQFKFAAAQFRSVERRLIVVAEKVFVVRAAAGSCRGQKMLGQDHFRAQSRTVGTVAAFSNAIEPVAGSDDPGIGGGTFQVLTEIFEDGRMLRGKGSKVVDGFIDASRQAGGRDVMAQDSAVHHLREEGGLGDEFAHQVRNVFLAFGSEGFLVACTTAKGNHDHFALAGRDARSSDQTGGQKGTAQCNSRGATQKFAAGPGEVACEFQRSGCFCGGQASPVPCASR